MFIFLWIMFSVLFYFLTLFLVVLFMLSYCEVQEQGCQTVFIQWAEVNIHGAC